MKICFRNMSSANLKWKEYPKRIKEDCFFCIMVDSSWIFQSQLPLTHFSSFLPITAICWVYQIITKLWLIMINLFHHKYNDKNFKKGNKKPVSPPPTSFPWCNQFPPAQPAPPHNQSPQCNQSPRTTSIPPTQPVSPPQPVSPRNQYWMKKFFKPLM